MPHNEIYERFKILFPLYPIGASLWSPAGEDAIRIKLDKHMQFIFTFKGDRNWKFETIDSFLNSQLKHAL